MVSLSFPSYLTDRPPLPASHRFRHARINENNLRVSNNAVAFLITHHNDIFQGALMDLGSDANLAWKIWVFSRIARFLAVKEHSGREIGSKEDKKKSGC